MINPATIPICGHTPRRTNCLHCEAAPTVPLYLTSDKTVLVSMKEQVTWTGSLAIPKILHRIWLGSKPIPQEFQDYWKTWLKLHPDWECHTWRDADVQALKHSLQRVYHECRNPAEQSDIMRFELIRQFGGVYVDTDFAAYKNIEPTLREATFVSCYEPSKLVGSAFFGATPNHPILERIVQRLQKLKIDPTLNQVWTAGPGMFTEEIKKSPESEYRLLPTWTYYPFDYGDTGTAEKYPNAYAGHYWSHTWKDWWVTLTIQVIGGNGMERHLTLESIDKTQLGEGDIVQTNANAPLTTMHVWRIKAGDRITPDGLKKVRHAIRHAANYGAMDFRFRDDEGNWIRVDTLQDRGHEISRHEEVVLEKLKKESLSKINLLQ